MVKPTSFMLLAALLFAGCAAQVPQSATQVKIGDRSVYYLPWRSDTKGGPELVGMDLYDESARLINRAYAAGKSIAAGVTEGLGAAAVNGVGLGVPAALGAFQTHINENTSNTVGSANSQGQIQGQGQGQQQGQLAVSESSSKATANASSTNTNVNDLTATQKVHTTNGGGGPSCQGNCSDNPGNHNGD